MKTYSDFVAGLTATPAIVAHRGAWHGAPENSISAIGAAALAGFEIVEVDVRRSADGVLFIMHDPRLDRTTDTTGPSEALTMSELSALKLREGRGGADAPLTTEAIPTLDAALDAARGRVYLDLDVKDPANFVAVGERVAARGMNGQADIKLTVADRDDVRRQAELSRRFDMLVMPMIRFDARSADAMIDLVAEMRPAMVECSFDTLETIGLVSAELRALGAATWINTLPRSIPESLDDHRAVVDEDAVWGALLAAGVTVIQTDEPERLQAYRDRRNGAESTGRA